MRRPFSTAWPRRRAYAPAALLAGVLAAACAEPPRPPTVVLVSLDTTRADHLSLYGYGRATDPHLSALAARSRVFEAAFPTATWTLPSHVSTFTGLDPAEHGCWRRIEDGGPEAVRGVSPSTPLFTRRLAAAGYHQIAAVGGPFTSARYGLLRDFDEHLDPGDGWELPAAELNAFLFEALERRPRNRPLFLFVNYFDAHAPYDAVDDRDYPFPADGRELPAVPPLEARTPEDGPPPPELVRDAIDQYDRELLVQDAALGALLARLEEEGLLADALIVVTGDHGEMFGEEVGVFGHGCVPFEGVARVPLVIHRSPDGPTGRVATPVSLANVPRTILTAAGLPPLPDGGVPRFDLLALPPEPPPPYVEHRGGGDWIGVVRGERFKLGAPMDPDGGQAPLDGLLVDLAAEAGESVPATGPEAEAAARELGAHLQDLSRAWLSPPDDHPRPELDEEALERLRALGYGR